MYLRRTERRTKDGAVGYLQLAHNEWDPASKQSKVRVLYNFGREDLLDRDAIVRLIGSLQRALEPDQALATRAAPDLQFIESRPMGGAWALDGLWRELQVDRTLERLLEGRRLDRRAERVIFAMVANRALKPLSKLACSKWVTEHAWIAGLSELDEDSCYRSMDWLLAVQDELCEAVYFATADLLNLEVDCCSSIRPRPTSSVTRKSKTSSITTATWSARRSECAGTARTIATTCPRS